MYCTLEEAYNISSHPKRGKSVLRAPATPSPPEEFDQYAPSSGRELPAYRRGGQREDFTGARPVERPTYAGMQNDYKYYCDNYRVCAPGLTEGFEDVPSKGKPATQPKPKPQPQPQQCGPLQPPAYEIPIPDEARKYYKEAVDTSLYQEQTATLPPKPKAREVDMSKVTGYYDEDLEMYLETKDMKASPVPVAPALPKKVLDALPYDPEASPFSQAMKDLNADANKVAPVQGKTFVDRLTLTAMQRDTKGMWFDLLLFFAVGILFVFLCDSLVRLGVLIGMKKTTEILAPFLDASRK